MRDHRRGCPAELAGESTMNVRITRFRDPADDHRRRPAHIDLADQHGINVNNTFVFAGRVRFATVVGSLPMFSTHYVGQVRAGLGALQMPSRLAMPMDWRPACRKVGLVPEANRAAQKRQDFLIE